MGKRQPKPEEGFQATLIATARLFGWRHYHTHDSRRSPDGFPDLVLVNRKRRVVIFAELKAPKGEYSVAQLEWLQDLCDVAENAGGAVAVYRWTEKDWSEIERVLKGQ